MLDVLIFRQTLVFPVDELKQNIRVTDAKADVSVKNELNINIFYYLLVH